MAPRSKVHLLPDEVRQALEQRLIAGGFAGYDALSDWLTEQGFEISKSSLHRFGSQFEDRIKAMRIATDQARAVVAATPDDEGSMGLALTRLVQQQLFDVLVNLQVDPDTLNIQKITRAVADLARASVTQTKHAAEVRRQAREELLAEQAKVIDKVTKSAGLSAETADTLRRQILGIGSK